MHLTIPDVDLCNLTARCRCSPMDCILPGHHILLSDTIGQVRRQLVGFTDVSVVSFFD